MRDPKRIPQMLGKLRAVWEAHPDMRLGQMIANMAPPERSIFNIEDDKWDHALDEAIQGRWNRLEPPSREGSRA